MADTLQDILTSLIPPPLFRILAGFSNLIYRLTTGASNDPTSWTSTLLPPLIALLFAYFSLILAYRTIRSTVLLVIWAVKWGMVLGVALAFWAWWTGQEDAVRSVGEVPGFFNGAPVIAGPLLSALYAQLKRRGGSGSGENGQGAPHIIQGDYGTSTDSLQSLAESVGLGSVVDAQGNADLGSLTPTWMSAIVEELSRSSSSRNEATSGNSNNRRRRRNQQQSRSRTGTTTPSPPRTRRQTRRREAEEAEHDDDEHSSDGEDSATEDLRTLARLVRRQYDRLMGGAGDGGDSSDEM